MHIIIRHLAAAALLAGAAAAAPAPAHAQREVTETAGDPFVHRQAGVRFPATIGGFRRGRVFEFDGDGRDASVGYKPPAMPGEMTVYVYPRNGSECWSLFNSADQAVMNREGTTRRDEDRSLKLLAGGGSEQISARYTVPAGAMGAPHPELVSYLWVGCPSGSDWVVKYRGSFEVKNESEATRLSEALFAAIDWTPVLAK